MAKDDKIDEEQTALTTTGDSSIGWVKFAAGVVLLAVGVLVALALAGTILKWGLLLLALYGGWVLVRRWLADDTTAVDDLGLLVDERDELDELDLLEQDHQLDTLKANMQDEDPRSNRDG